MKILIPIIALVIAVFLAPLLFPPGGSEAVRPSGEGLPWQIIKLDNGGTRVFGLTLGVSKLGEARTVLGDAPQVAIVGTRDEAGTLEAYFESVRLDYLTGKMILTADLPQATVEAMRQRAIKTDYMESTTRRSTLSPADLETAMNAPIRAIAFIPSVNLDEATVLQRFGPPGERIRGSETAEHLLYADKGLDIVLDSKGKELLQYVAPRHFESLREPLLTAPTKH
jgi:hypothetical protein